jgi:hypothetical protein
MEVKKYIRILDLEDEVHLMWIIWTNGLQECKGDSIFQSWVERATIFGRDLKILDLFCGGYSEMLDHRPRPYPPPFESS